MSARPVASYRVQLTPELGFDAVVGILDHLERLRISHVYLSPIAQAVPDSSHGYDVVDHTRVRAEFGGEAAFERLLDAVAARAMAVLIDHVPNHVASTRPDLNRHWWQLLRDGRGSPADDWFDVDWEAGGGRVILPVLGAALDAVVDAGQLVVDDGSLVLYGERRLPLSGPTEDRPLAELLDAQHYVLRPWYEPARNVRRFFTIDDLVAVRVEHEHVAEVVDTLPARYHAHPGFGGVRVDHVDGLADPERYLRGLRSRIGDEALLYVEKIVAPGEWLPASWPVDGTTGYEFIRAVDHVLLAADAGPAFTARWMEDSGDPRSFHEYELEARREVVDEALAPDLARLTGLARRAVGGDPEALADELRRLTISLPRYRTYLPGDPDADALVGAISDGPVARAILDPVTPEQAELRTRWQQLTGPVMAKGAEDRSFYRYLRMAALCEVGGDPGAFGLTVGAFHAENAHRQRSWPRALLAASTHDTKRSEDVRARAIALTWSTVAGDAAAVDRDHGRWRAWVDGLVAATGLDAVAVSLALQTAVCTPGLDAPRLTEYLVKACREAARHTTWEDPDTDYEERLARLAAAAVDGEREWAALDLARVADGVSLAATVLRITSPGVPDVYQGCEAFSYRLVDPDNRVPPDWAGLRSLTADARSVAELWAAGEPAVKPVLVRTLLQLRRRHADGFGATGSYDPLDADPGVVAYRRGEDVVVVVRRGLAAVAGPIELPAGTWRDVVDPGRGPLTGPVPLAALVGDGTGRVPPVAVLERAG